MAQMSHLSTLRAPLDKSVAESAAKLPQLSTERMRGVVHEISKCFRVPSVSLPEECHHVVCAFPELLDFLIPNWCTHLAHCGDNIRGKPLDVYSVVVSLLTNQVHVQHLHDLGPHPIGTRIKE